jgi:hypothetical protein
MTPKALPLYSGFDRLIFGVEILEIHEIPVIIVSSGAMNQGSFRSR